MRLRALLLGLFVAFIMLPVTGAAAAEQFIGVDIENELVSFTSDADTYTSHGVLSGGTGYVILGLHRLPGGGLIALDAAGHVDDVDASTAALSVRYGGAVPGFGYSGGTFAVTPDGHYALLATAGKAELLDLATGATTPVVLPGYATGDPGAARTIAPLLDVRPDGTLVGVDKTVAPAVIAQAAPGGPFGTLGAISVAVTGNSQFALAPDGTAGWLVTRAASHVTRLIAINPTTGATDAPGTTFADGFNAIVPLGPTSSPVTPPAGPPAPVTGTPPPSTGLRLSVTVTAPARQSAAGIARRRAIRLSLTSSEAAGVSVTARLGSHVVARVTRALAARRAARLSVPTTHGAAALIRRDVGKTVVLQITVRAGAKRITLRRSVKLVA